MCVCECVCVNVCVCVCVCVRVRAHASRLGVPEALRSAEDAQLEVVLAWWSTLSFHNQRLQLMRALSKAFQADNGGGRAAGGGGTLWGQGESGGGDMSGLWMLDELCWCLSSLSSCLSTLSSRQAGFPTASFRACHVIRLLLNGSIKLSR
jgi:hypothetical protein